MRKTSHRKYNHGNKLRHEYHLAYIAKIRQTQLSSECLRTLCHSVQLPSSINLAMIETLGSFCCSFVTWKLVLPWLAMMTHAASSSSAFSLISLAKWSVSVPATATCTCVDRPVMSVWHGMLACNVYVCCNNMQWCAGSMAVSWKVPDKISWISWDDWWSVSWSFPPHHWPVSGTQQEGWRSLRQKQCV